MKLHFKIYFHIQKIDLNIVQFLKVLTTDISLLGQNLGCEWILKILFENPATITENQTQTFTCLFIWEALWNIVLTYLEKHSLFQKLISKENDANLCIIQLPYNPLLHKQY